MEEYLKECGFKNVNGNFVFKRNDRFYPAISCRTKSNGDFYFVFHFNPVVGSCRVERPFTWKVDRKKFLEDCLGIENAKAFSVPDSLLQKVQNSRSKSQKPWKKRNYPIAFSKKVVYNILKVDKEVRHSKSKLTENIEMSEDVKLALSNMTVLERKAFEYRSYEYFIPWYDEFKKYSRYARKKSKADNAISNNVIKLRNAEKITQDKAFNIFKNKVEALRRNS